MKIFVGNLSFKISDDELKKLFSPYGEISEAVVIRDRMSGRSKGFGFVTFADDESGKKAIEEMNGKTVEEREITVNEARPMRE
jgi:RNA recognition motif-containing protein